MIRPLEHLTLGISVLLKTPFETPKCYTFETLNLQNIEPSEFRTFGFLDSHQAIYRLLFGLNGMVKCIWFS